MFFMLFKSIISVITFSDKFIFIIRPALLFYADDTGSTLAQKLINIYEAHGITSCKNISLNFVFTYQATGCEIFFLTK